MNQQPDKMTAYYYRAAKFNSDLYLDNQMYRLLQHAMANSAKAFVLYVDNGVGGVNFDRPAFNKMLADIAKGGISKIVAANASRIARSSSDILLFTEKATHCGVKIETLDGEDFQAIMEVTRKTMDALCSEYAAMKGGDRK